jgi:tetratricopeptide (TPR) repeat protein
MDDTTATLLPWTIRTPLTPEELEFLRHLPPSPPLFGALHARIRGKDAFLEYVGNNPYEMVAELFREAEAALARNAAARALGVCGLAMRLTMELEGPESHNTQIIWDRLATALYRCGKMDQAVTLQRALIKCMMVRHRRPIDLIMAKATFAQMLLDTDHAAEALAIQRKLIEEARVTLGSGVPLVEHLRNDMAMSLLKLGLHHEAEAELASIETELSEANDVFAHVARMNRAAAAYTKGDYARTLEIELEGLACLRKSVGSSHRFTILALNNLALTLRRLGRIAEAAVFLKEAAASARQINDADHPDTAIVYTHYLAVLMELGKPELALPIVSDIFPKIEALQLYGGFMFSIAAASAWCIAGIIADQESSTELKGEALGLYESMPSVSTTLCDAAELLNFDSTDVSLENLRTFHTWWLKICVLRRPQLLMRSAAALHGLESLAAVIQLLEPTEREGETSVAGEFFDARKSLKDIRDQLSAEYQIDSPRLFNYAIPLQDLMSLEKAALLRYRQARKQMKLADSTFSAVSLDNVLSHLERPAELLSTGEAIVLTVSLGRGYSVAHITLWTGETLLAPLQGFEEIAEYNDCDVIGLRRAVREELRADRGVVVANKSLSLNELREQAFSAFWLPVLSCLADTGWDRSSVHRLHIVTAPSHHNKPLEMANPGVVALYYCGIPAFLRHRASPRSQKLPCDTRILIDQALGSSRPIPFTQVEGRLAEIILGCDGPVKLLKASVPNAMQASRRLLLSCHGGVAGSGAGRHGFLLLDAEKEIHLQVAEASAVQSDEIIVSACVAGVVGHSDRGDALGLVALWQLRGVGAIVSCTAPVHDFYMPVMTMLYLHNRVCRLAADMALRESKIQFSSGNWPAECVSMLRDIYRNEMEQVLIRCSREPKDMCAFSTVLAWPLRQDQRDLLHAACQSGAVLHVREGLAASWAKPEVRGEWIEPCLQALIDKRSNRDSGADPVQEQIAAIIEHICAFTLCHGTV